MLLLEGYINFLYGIGLYFHFKYMWLGHIFFGLLYFWGNNLKYETLNKFILYILYIKTELYSRPMIYRCNDKFIFSFFFFYKICQTRHECFILILYTAEFSILFKFLFRKIFKKSIL